MTRYRIVQTISEYQNSVTDIGTRSHNLRRYRRHIGPDMTPISANLRRYLLRYDIDIGVNYGTPVSCHLRYREFFHRYRRKRRYRGRYYTDIGVISVYTRTKLPPLISGFSPTSAPICTRYCKQYQNIPRSASIFNDIGSNM